MDSKSVVIIKSAKKLVLVIFILKLLNFILKTVLKSFFHQKPGLNIRFFFFSIIFHSSLSPRTILFKRLLNFFSLLRLNCWLANMIICYISCNQSFIFSLQFLSNNFYQLSGGSNSCMPRPAFHWQFSQLKYYWPWVVPLWLSTYKSWDFQFRYHQKSFYFCIIPNSQLDSELNILKINIFKSFTVKRFKVFLHSVYERKLILIWNVLKKKLSLIPDWNIKILSCTWLK